MEQVKEKNETKENIMGTMKEGKLLFKLSMPMILSTMVDSLYNLFDSMFVGRLGDNALTAMSLATPITSIMLEIGFGVSIGVNALLSKRLGEKDQKAVNKIAGNGIFLAIIISLIFTVIGFFAIEPYFKSQTSNVEIQNLGISYLRIICIFSLGLQIQTLMERLLSSTGKTKQSMIILLVGALMNLCMDPILIFGYFGVPRLGMSGAAISTVISQFAAATVGLILNIKTNKDIQLKVKEIIPNLRVLKEIIIIAIPATLTYSINSILIFGMNKALISVNETAPAVYVVYTRIRSFVVLPIWGIRNTIISIIAYNYGANKLDRVKNTIKLSIKSSIVILAIGTILFETIPGLLISIFSSSEEIMSIGIPAMRIIGTAHIIAGNSIILSGVFQALGQSSKSLIVSIVQTIVVIGVAFAFSSINNLNMIWTAFPISEVVIFIISMILYKGIKKKYLNKEATA